jgi:Flp pilus assembly protein TadD
LAATLIFGGVLVPAIGFFFAAARLAPTNAQYLEDLAVALFKTGDLKQAKEKLQRALPLRPNSAAAHNLRGAIHGQQGSGRRHR